MTTAEATLWAQGKSGEAAATVSTLVGQGVDAIGRAYLAGLLTCPDRSAEQMRDAGRLLFKLYWSHYSELRGMAVSSFYQALVSGGSVRGGATSDARRWEVIERALNDRLAALDDMGREVRSAVESLCIDQHFDDGPAWLDRLIAGRGDAADRRRMMLAADGLAVIS